MILAGVLPLYQSYDDSVCRAILLPWVVQSAQAIIFMIDKINKDPTILPNTPLGFVLLNDCMRDVLASSRATQVLPVSTCVRDRCGVGPNINSTEIRKQTTFNVHVIMVCYTMACFHVISIALISK